MRYALPVHVTNFGYAYCASHDVDQPGMLGEKCGQPHVVTATVDAGSAAGWCDWPGCEQEFSVCELDRKRA